MGNPLPAAATIGDPTICRRENIYVSDRDTVVTLNPSGLNQRSSRVYHKSIALKILAVTADIAVFTCVHNLFYNPYSNISLCQGLEV